MNAKPEVPASRGDMFDAAHFKLGIARAIVDAVAMLDVSDSMDSLKPGSLTACLLHVDELLDEAKEMFVTAQAQPLARV